MDVTVIVTTFGDPWWEQLAMERAYRSAIPQAMTVMHHTNECVSLGDARNQAVDRYDPQDWICFLDADDELAPGYIDAMSNVPHVDESYLLIPSQQYGVGGEVVCHMHRKIMKMNPCPIGTLIHRSMFEEAGRFWDEPAWEDWSLFRRAFILDAKLEFVRNAIYIDHASVTGRNSNVSNPKRLWRSIVKSHETWALNR